MSEQSARDAIESRLRVLDLQLLAEGEHVLDERLASIVSGTDPTDSEASHLAGCDECLDVLMLAGSGFEELMAVYPESVAASERSSLLALAQPKKRRTASLAVALVLVAGAAAAGLGLWRLTTTTSAPSPQPDAPERRSAERGLLAPRLDDAPVEQEGPRIVLPEPAEPVALGVGAVESARKPMMSRATATPAALEPSPGDLRGRERELHGPSKPLNGPPRGFGALRINSKPPSRVIVDGKVRGWTPLVDLRLPEGPHDVELIYESEQAHKKTERFRVLIEPEQTWSTIRRNMKPAITP